jgi:hypothetical protein
MSEQAYLIESRRFPIDEEVIRSGSREDIAEVFRRFAISQEKAWVEIANAVNQLVARVEALEP